VILGLETSCDDTCAAVVDGAAVRSNVISSQGVHDRYGGVVPEIASRHHLELVNAVVDDALARADARLDDVDLVAVTQGPGLVGALLVGLQTAKGLAAARRLPLAPVDHLHGHVAATFLEPDPLQPPFLCLIASGGHTLLADVREPGDFEVIGQTLDDAAGEAFDKGARLLGLPYPGGPALEALAADGDPAAHAFPTAEGVGGLDFSFAGLKTALLYRLRDLGEARAAAARADSAAPTTRRPEASHASRATSSEWVLPVPAAARTTSTPSPERVSERTILSCSPARPGLAVRAALTRASSAVPAPSPLRASAPAASRASQASIPGVVYLAPVARTTRLPSRRRIVSGPTSAGRPSTGTA